MKTTKIIYWLTTGLLFLFEGVLVALTSNSEIAIEGIRHLGYPDYFRVMLGVFKVLGAIVLISPFIKQPFKEWAYAGFTFVFISAFVSHLVVDGFGGQTMFPLFFLGVLTVSYKSYEKLNDKSLIYKRKVVKKPVSNTIVNV